MEETPLSIAHQNALHASKLLASSPAPHPPALLLTASASHALAATSFASAAKTTKDSEAHRTLELLVAEHEGWAIRLKRIAERPIEPESSNPEQDNDDGETPPSSKQCEVSPTPSRERERAAPPPVLPLANTSGVPHYPARLQKSTSSLATNLASARGIPQTSSATSASRRRRLPASTSPSSSTPTEPSSSSSKPTTNPLSLLPPDHPPSPESAATQEENFSKFYTSLNSLIHRIGSPFAASLAFAGLPVGEPSPGTPDLPPDLLPKGYGSHLHPKNGPGHGGESFYVVPVSGGTMTYAGVVRRDEAKATPTTGVHRDEEFARFAGHQKTFEELQLENAALRRSIEQMSRTMQKWQQKSREGENMLKNSIMALNRPNGPSGVDILHQVQRRSWFHTPLNEEEVTVKPDGEIYSEGRMVGELEAAKERERELEETIRKLQTELQESRIHMEKLHGDNEKLKRTVGKMKEKWDDLRDKAKKRQSTQTSGGGVQLSKVEETGE